MSTTEKTVLTISASINAPIARVWESWNEPKHIVNWAFASDEWHAPSSENDLREGGAFKTVMAAKDGSMAFDFHGTYDVVETHKHISYTLGDGRKVQTYFTNSEDGVFITQSFEAEDMNPLEMQQGGWQAILNNFKQYTESL